MSMTSPLSSSVESPAATEVQIEEVHRLCLESRQQIELVYQLLYFVGERLAANPDEFYRFVQELKAYVQSNTH
jgi:hypothetical protein